MDESKLSFLQQLNPKIDWKLEMIKKEASSSSTSGGSSSKGFKSPLRKLTKSQKKTAKRNLALTLAQQANSNKGVETLIFENPDATWKRGDGKGGRRLRSGGTSGGSQGIEIDMKKTRFEIMKFGMTGMSVEEKADAETQLAISLGAQPDKTPFVNYKELQETRKIEKEVKEAKEASMIKPKLKLKSNRGAVGKKSKTSNKLSANNVVVKGANRTKSGGGGGGSKETGPRKGFLGGKRPDKRNREAARKNR